MAHFPELLEGGSVILLGKVSQRQIKVRIGIIRRQPQGVDVGIHGV
ncbi:MAG: hypothetical protein VCE91_16650 [Nitrospinota bacterium]